MVQAGGYQLGQDNRRQSSPLSRRLSFNLPFCARCDACRRLGMAMEGRLSKGPLDPADFDLPPLDALMDDRCVLEGDLLAQWREDEPTAAGGGGAVSVYATDVVEPNSRSTARSAAPSAARSAAPSAAHPTFCPPGTTSGGSECKPPSDEEKLERVRAQNRAKTARYRQRQKVGARSSPTGRGGPGVHPLRSPLPPLIAHVACPAAGPHGTASE